MYIHFFNWSASGKMPYTVKWMADTNNITLVFFDRKSRHALLLMLHPLTIPTFVAWQGQSVKADLDTYSYIITTPIHMIENINIWPEDKHNMHICIYQWTGSGNFYN